MKRMRRNVEFGTFLLIATALVMPTAAAVVGIGNWWVGPCTGLFVHREGIDVQQFSGDVQGDDPAGAAATFAGESATNGKTYASCVVPSRVQIVTVGHTVDVKVVNCVDACDYQWQVVDQARLTLRCLDDNSTSTAVAPDTPSLPHPCIVESTLERFRGDESAVLWRVSDCDDPACTPWPQDLLPSG